MIKEHWEIIDTGQKSASENMRLDAELLEKAERHAHPILHLYDWDAPSATFGHFIDPFQLLDNEQVKRRGLHLARRPTGGGILFHLWDMAFSILVPAQCPEFSTNTLANYAFINQAVLQAVRAFIAVDAPLTLIEENGMALDASCGHFCMAKPTKYDVLLNGKKVAGAAQRRTKKGFLHQGSISLQMPSKDYLDEVLLAGSFVSEAMQTVACPLLSIDASPEQVANAKERLKALLATHLNAASLKLHL